MCTLNATIVGDYMTQLEERVERGDKLSDWINCLRS